MGGSRCHAGKLQDPWRIPADAANIAGQQRLHHQSLNHANEQGDGRLDIQRAIQFSLGLAVLDHPPQALSIMAGQRLHDALGSRLPRPLQFAKQHARHTRVIRNKIDMSDKDRFQHGKRRRDPLRCLVHSREQALRHPGHDCLQNGVLGGKVAEQCTLGQTHALGNGGGGDVIGILFSGQFDHCLDGDRPPFVCRQVLYTGRHGTYP